MGVGADLYMYVVVVQKFTFAISSPDEFLLPFARIIRGVDFNIFLGGVGSRARLRSVWALGCHSFEISSKVVISFLVAMDLVVRLLKY